MRKSTTMPEFGRPAVGTVPCVLLALASAASAGERRPAAGQAAEALEKAVDALVPKREPPAPASESEDWKKSLTEWIAYHGSDPYPTIKPEEFGRSVRRLKAGLRRLAATGTREDEAFPPALRDEFRYRRQRKKLWALEMLAALRDPADLPLFWKSLAMYPPHTRDPGRRWRLDHDRCPVAEVMGGYGEAASRFIVERIAGGDTDGWTLKRSQRELSALIVVLARAAGYYDVLLYREAARRPEAEKERLLKCLQKFHGGRPLDEILPKIEKRSREKAARATGEPADRPGDGTGGSSAGEAD